MEQERTLALALCRVEGIGAVSIRKLLEKAGDVSEIRKLPAESLQKLLGEKKAAFLKNWDAPENLELAKRQEEQWKKKGISFDFLWEEAFPKRLKEISDPPLVLYRIGKLPEPEKKMTAIVGARACSSYGKEMAEYFARGLAKEGIKVNINVRDNKTTNIFFITCSPSVSWMFCFCCYMYHIGGRLKKD